MKKFLLALGAALLVASPIHAQDRITLQVGYSPGGSYDRVSRLVAEHLGRHLEGTPDIIVENVPGAGSLVLGRQIMAESATDGNRIATVSSALALRPVFAPDSEDFDPTQVHYLASMSNAASYCVSHKNSGIETFAQLLSDPDATVGATGKSSTTYTFPAALRSALGGEYKIVSGFDGGTEIILAMERGEIDVRCGIGMNTLTLNDNLSRFNVIAELALQPKGEIDGPVFALDLAPDAMTREALALALASSEVHFPIVAPPAADPEVVAALRDAFRALMTDEAFIAASEAGNLYTRITPGDEVEAMIAGFLAASPEVRAMARAFVE
ncbi:MAG: Bug family tripartite tricarboxylate transporter substrate binding protein [Yoonia sp.]|uniref:Bug family tripartite tricarboxylate transporter substrate binding protein n=1 Tax=Yoonia sp. TaxID=2212373 RepID=UPI003EF3D0F4